MEVFHVTSTHQTRAFSDHRVPAVSVEVRRFMLSKLLNPGDVWYAYENRVTHSETYGYRKYRICGARQNCKTAPLHPDTDDAYVRIGLVDLLTGDILRC